MATAWSLSVSHFVIAVMWRYSALEFTNELSTMLLALVCVCVCIPLLLQFYAVIYLNSFSSIYLNVIIMRSAWSFKDFTRKQKKHEKLKMRKTKRAEEKEKDTFLIRAQIFAT